MGGAVGLWVVDCVVIERCLSGHDFASTRRWSTVRDNTSCILGDNSERNLATNT